MMQNKKVYLEAIRIFAILGVIFNHTDGFIYYMHTDNVITWLYSIVLAMVSRTAVPLFFMVSGALLLGKEESLKDLFVKRVLRILGVLLTVSVLYYLFDIARGTTEVFSLSELLMKIAGGGIRPSFWFLYEYLFFLLVLPFFRKLAPLISAKLMVYLVVLRGIFSLVLPVFEELTGVTVKFDISFGGGYLYFALLGYFLCEKGEALADSCKTGILWLMLLFATGLNVAEEVFAFGVNGAYSERLLDGVVFFTAPMWWLLIKRLTQKMTEKLSEQESEQEKTGTIIATIGSCVFGIYLFENLVRWQLLPLYLFLSEKTIGILACSVYVVLTFAVGLIYTLVLKKIPVIGKYI